MTARGVRADAAAKAARLFDNPDAVMTQDEWLAEFYDPQPGQHHTFIGPNNSGKTTLGLKCLARAHELNPKTRGVALVMKPHRAPEGEPKARTGDPTVARLTRELGGRVVRSYPLPRRLPWSEEPAYWALWPKSTFDFDKDEQTFGDMFYSAIQDSYARGNRWVFGDEALGLTKRLNLGKYLALTLAQGRSMNCGMMLATQRPAFVPTEMYSEAKHFFLWSMRDPAIYERLDEIGNVDRGFVGAVLSQLDTRMGKHACLYLHPDTQTVAVLT